MINVKAYHVSFNVFNTTDFIKVLSFVKEVAIFLI